MGAGRGLDLAVIGPRRCIDLPRRLVTERLMLRPLAVTDAHAMFSRWGSDPAATEYMSWPTHRTVADAAEFLEGAEARWHEGAIQDYGIELPDVGLIGTFGAGIRGQSAMLGYIIGAPWWGNGYVAEAGHAIVRELHAEGSVHRIWAYAHHEHRGSHRVLEKLGMSFEGVMVAAGVFPQLGGGALPCALYGMAA